MSSACSSPSGSVTCVGEFLAAFPQEEYYLSEDAVRRAMTRHSMFNILHPASGLKVDVMIPADSLFNRNRFERSKRVKPADVSEGPPGSPSIRGIGRDGP
jgi:hypothetical protein